MLYALKVHLLYFIQRALFHFYALEVSTCIETFLSTFTGLRRELDNITFKRTLKNGSSSDEIKDLSGKLKAILDQDKPPKLFIPGGE